MMNKSTSYTNPELVLYRDSSGKELSFYLKGKQLYLKRSNISSDFLVDIEKLLNFYVNNTEGKRK